MIHFIGHHGLLIGALMWCAGATVNFMTARKWRNARREFERTLERYGGADQVLMQLTERIERAKALAEGQKARLIRDGWNETIAEQMAAAFLFAALNAEQTAQ